MVDAAFVKLIEATFKFYNLNLTFKNIIILFYTMFISYILNAYLTKTFNFFYFIYNIMMSF